jgi:hypothetical protein
VFVDSADAATSLCLHLRERFATEPMLELKVCAARNEGARITATSDAAVRKRARLSASG